MRIYTDVLLDIYEAEANGEITKSERDYLIMEMKTKQEYSKRKFKEKYNFKPTDPKNPDKGTITVDGKTYNVDMGNTITVSDPHSGAIIQRQTAASLEENGIIIEPKSFFSLKNQKRRDAILQHEVGHLKLHNITANKEVIDGSVMTAKTIDSVLRNTILDQIETLCTYGGTTMSQKDKEDMIKDKMKELKSLKKKYIRNIPNTDKNKKRLRDEARDILQKYAKGQHANTTEFEADRYAENQVPGGHITKAARETYKYNKKHDKLMTLDEYRRMFNNLDPGNKENNKMATKVYHQMKSSRSKVEQNDMNRRSKALKDKEIRLNYKNIYGMRKYDELQSQLDKLKEQRNELREQVKNNQNVNKNKKKIQDIHIEMIQLQRQIDEEKKKHK